MYPSSAVPDIFSRPVSGDIAASRSQGLENRIKLLDGFFRAAEHHAVTALQAPDAAAGADVHVVDAFIFKFLRAADVILEIGVAAINQDVARGKFASQLVNSLFRRAAGRDHHPRDLRFAEFAGKIVDRGRRDRAFTGDFLDIVGAKIGDYHFVPTAHQTTRHVRAHPA